MALLNRIIRRVFAWPLVVIGAVLVQLGGGLIMAGAWTMDYDVAALLKEVRGEK